MFNIKTDAGALTPKPEYFQRREGIFQLRSVAMALKAWSRIYNNLDLKTAHIDLIL